MPFAEADDIGKVYSYPGQQIVALKPVRFSIEAGEYVMITGESGAGKSTLLSLIGALDRPTSGRMCVAGADFATMNAAALSSAMPIPKWSQEGSKRPCGKARPSASA